MKFNLFNKTTLVALVVAVSAIPMSFASTPVIQSTTVQSQSISSDTSVTQQINALSNKITYLINKDMKLQDEVNNDPSNVTLQGELWQCNNELNQAANALGNLYSENVF